MSRGSAGDQTVESPEVKVPVGWAEARSAPTRGASKSFNFVVDRDCAKAGLLLPIGGLDTDCCEVGQC
jgi:hypothetical protein